MARKLRLEYPGACYHVINRGNYRSAIFESDQTKAAFVACLFEACKKSGWLLHAHVVMRNHYHLAIETPLGHLVAGMQWLQATFANRFNRRRGVNGHLFQGRYKAFLVEEGEPLAAVAHYIHLNPVRAGVISVDRLDEYRHSSYWFLRRKGARPACLSLDVLMAQTGLIDAPPGWRKYAEYLQWEAVDGPLGRADAFKTMSQGWALGSEEFKAGLVREHALLALARAWEDKGAQEIRTLHWEDHCHRALRILGRSDRDLEQTGGCASWKAALAAFLKERTQASNSWLGRRLCIGSAKYVSRLAAAASSARPTLPELQTLRRHGET